MKFRSWALSPKRYSATAVATTETAHTAINLDHPSASVRHSRDGMAKAVAMTVTTLTSTSLTYIITGNLTMSLRSQRRTNKSMVYITR